MTIPKGEVYEGSEKQAYMDAYYLRNREKMIAEAKQYRRLIKQCVMDHYGKICKCCGEDNIAFLNIDHIDGNGNTHRKEIGKSSGIGFYTWLKKNNFPEGFQTLCFNCNIARYKNGGICPHQQEPT
jgi:hypothetical protein